jgi:hypothetical protein
VERDRSLSRSLERRQVWTVVMTGWRRRGDWSGFCCAYAGILSPVTAFSRHRGHVVDAGCDLNSDEFTAKSGRCKAYCIEMLLLAKLLLLTGKSSQSKLDGVILCSHILRSEWDRSPILANLTSEGLRNMEL